MATVYYPKIGPADYDTFRSEPNLNLPDTYDEWLNLSHKELREIELVGDTFKEIEINPDEFARFCQAKRKARTFDALRQFAAAKGSGQSY